MTHRSGEPLHIRILLWLAVLKVVQPNILFIRPFHDLATEEFRTAITADGLGFATPFHDALQHPDDA